MVLRSTRVMRSISRWLLPAASKAPTVVFRCGFKTFTPNSLDDRREKDNVLPRVAPGAFRQRLIALSCGYGVEEFEVATSGGI